MKTMLRYLLLCSFFIPAGIIAQLTVSGTVTEEGTGQPLPGVNVIIKGTTTGTATDFDGNYQIDANEGDILSFSYVSFKTQEVPVSGSTLDVIMQEDAALLDEVVVVGYGSVRKEDLTGSVDLVTTEDFNQGPVVSPQQLIQGKIAGVSVVSGGGAPGEGSNVLIRGIGSLNLNSNPLFVVDGVPLNDGGVAGTRNPLNLINPNDIEAMSILKDASATSIYGSRAANGVILITTKKGKAGEVKFNYRGTSSIYEPTDFVNVLSPTQFRALVTATGNTDFIDRLGTTNTDWQDLIYTSAFSSDHSISATGAVFGVPLRASIGYTDQGGILKEDNLNRITSSVSLTPRFFEDHLKLEINARHTYTENDFADRGAIGSASGFDPTKPVYDPESPFFAFNDENGNQVGYYTWLNNARTGQLSLAPTNPIALLDLIEDRANVRRFITNIKADYDLPFLEGLTATVNAGFDLSDSGGFRNTPNNLPTSSVGFDGSRNTYENRAENYLFDAYLTYKKAFGDHNVNATAGYSYQRFEFDNFSRNTSRILDANGNLDTDASDNLTFIDKSENVLLSYFGRLNYDYKGKYLLTATLRADASSKLNPNDRWGYFPSAALAWNLRKESFMEESSFDQLKLRLGYGEVGNVNGLGDYNFLTRYVRSTSTADYQFGTGFFQTFRPEPINENLRWEVGNTTNAGLDFSVFEGRISGSFNAYIKKTKDLIATTTIDPFTNFGNTISANIGDMENKGIEFEMTVVPIRTEELEWSIGYNISFNDNKITRLPDTQDVGGISGGVGNTVQRHEFDRAPFTYFVYKQIYNTNGKPIEGAFADLNGDGQINSNDRYFYRNPYADILMGLNTNASYKNFDLSVVSRASIGNYVYNNVASQTAFANITRNDILSNIHADYLDTQFQQFTETNLLSDHFVEEASFFRLDNVTLGYTFQEGFNKKPLRFYVAANNVLVVTDYKGLDPEITGGIDNNFYPRPKIYLLGVDINF